MSFYKLAFPSMTKEHQNNYYSPCISMIWSMQDAAQMQLKGSLTSNVIWPTFAGPSIHIDKDYISQFRSVVFSCLKSKGLSIDVPLKRETNGNISSVDAKKVNDAMVMAFHEIFDNPRPAPTSKYANENFLPFTPGEASDLGMWRFINCCVIPDVIYWRWSRPSGGVSEERYIGTRRNYSYVIWQRAFILGNCPQAKQLDEDMMGAILERPSFYRYTKLLDRFVPKMIEGVANSKKKRETYRTWVSCLLATTNTIDIEMLSEEAIDRLVLSTKPAIY